MQTQETKKIESEIEDKLIDWITMDMGGRLIVVKPQQNQYDASLLVEKRADYDKGGLSLRVCSEIGPGKENKIIKDFEADEFLADKKFYLVFVYFDRVKQKIADYVWLVPSVDFKDLGDLVQSDQGKKVLRFEAPLNIEEKNRYSSFLVHTKKLGSTVFDILNSGKPSPRAAIFKEEKPVNLEDLKEFIKEARENTFASNSQPADNPRLLGSVQREFQKREFFYRDIYFSGNKNFIGQEIVYISQAPVWAMNYLGNKIDKLQEAFLKEALFRLANKCRLAENCEFEKREYKYENFGQGSLEDFSGLEKIAVSGKYIYKLEYRGGILSDKL